MLAVSILTLTPQTFLLMVWQVWTVSQGAQNMGLVDAF